MRGNAVFGHDCACAGRLQPGGMMEGILHETPDEDAGALKYFFITPDEPASACRLEFRYGSNTDDLMKYNEGSYAYWLPVSRWTPMKE